MKVQRLLFIISASLALLASPVLAQTADEELEPVAEEWRVGFESITAADAVNYVEFFASDELEGRDTASHGLRIARNYAASLFALWGIAPAGDIVEEKRTYNQIISVVISEPGPNSYLEVLSGTTSIRFQTDVDLFLGRGGGFETSGVIEAPVVFTGYGLSAPDLDYDDFAGIDVGGKIVVVLTGLPGGDRTDTPFAEPEIRERLGGWRRLRELRETLADRGAVALVRVGIYGEDTERSLLRRRSSGSYRQGSRIDPPGRDVSVPALSSISGSVPALFATQRIADALLAASGRTVADIKDVIDGTLEPHSFDMDGVTARIRIDVSQTADITGNVLGMIEGSDPELKDEVIVIGAHLDHLGMTDEGYVFNGADDNASGSAGVLELAQAFALNPVRPRRTILFALWTGEEKGLYGSRYFVQYPTVPLENIVACLNMDMIARDWSLEAVEQMARRFGVAATGAEITPELVSRLVSVQLSAQSPELNRIILEENREHIGLFVYTRPGDSQGGSDHVPFHRSDVPAAFFFSAMHEDYHAPTDTADRVNGEKMARIIRLVYLVAGEIAQMPERLPWVESEDESN